MGEERPAARSARVTGGRVKNCPGGQSLNRARCRDRQDGDFWRRVRANRIADDRREALAALVELAEEIADFVAEPFFDEDEPLPPPSREELAAWLGTLDEAISVLEEGGP
jgi:hypothetical protein